MNNINNLKVTFCLIFYCILASACTSWSYDLGDLCKKNSVKIVKGIKIDKACQNLIVTTIGNKINLGKYTIRCFESDKNSKIIYIENRNALHLSEDHPYARDEYLVLANNDWQIEKIDSLPYISLYKNDYFTVNFPRTWDVIRNDSELLWADGLRLNGTKREITIKKIGKSDSSLSAVIDSVVLKSKIKIIKLKPGKPYLSLNQKNIYQKTYTVLSEGKKLLSYNLLFDFSDSNSDSIQNSRAKNGIYLITILCSGSDLRKSRRSFERIVNSFQLLK